MCMSYPVTETAVVLLLGWLSALGKAASDPDGSQARCRRVMFPQCIVWTQLVPTWDPETRIIMDRHGSLAVSTETQAVGSFTAASLKGARGGVRGIEEGQRERLISQTSP